MSKIPFVKIHYTGNEAHYIRNASTLRGGGSYTRQCQILLEQYTQCEKVLLTHSCTAALEMSALLLDIKEGDEIIMPSYTFVSTANAFVLRKGIPVFVDVRPDTLNLDENKIEAAITSKTKAIVPVHYAGVACEMDRIRAIAEKYNLYVIEDAAQGVLAKYKGKTLGTLGHLGAYSFHETKNVISGEGGALLVNDIRFNEMADIIREKGTDRSRFFRGEVDNYTWQDIGSSYPPSELTAAFLLAQLEQARAITDRRLMIWEQYHHAFAEMENQGLLRRPIVPEGCEQNGHMYYLLLPNSTIRHHVMAHLKNAGINATLHYVPLHLTPGGKRFSRAHGDLTVTVDIAERIIRLPLYYAMTETDIERVVAAIREGVCEQPLLTA